MHSSPHCVQATYEHATIYLIMYVPNIHTSPLTVQIPLYILLHIDSIRFILMNMYSYLFIYIYYIYIHIYIYWYRLKRMERYGSILGHICTIHIYIYKHTHTYTYIHILSHTYTYTYTYVYVYVSKYIRMYMYTYTWAYIHSIPFHSIPSHHITVTGWAWSPFWTLSLSNGPCRCCGTWM